MPSITIAADVRQFAEALSLAAAALLPIVNPLGGAPIFLARTIDLDDAQHTLLAKRIARNCFLLLVASAAIGAYVLDFFGISIPVVQVGGGLVVCSLAWTLLNEPEAPTAQAKDAARALTPADLSKRAFYPLTMPLTVGPGSISVAITLGANQHQDLRDRVVLALGHMAGIVVVVLTVYLCYRYADVVLRKLGDVGTIVVAKLTAFILLCIGVQILWNGASTLLGIATTR